MGKKSREVRPIPCAHERSRDFHGPECSDYHQLSRRQIDRLLELALVYRNGRERHKIQCRLAQSIAGQVCPNLIEGPVAKKDNAFNHAYVRGLRQRSFSRGIRRDIYRALGVK